MPVPTVSEPDVLANGFAAALPILKRSPSKIRCPVAGSTTGLPPVFTYSGPESGSSDKRL